MLMNIPPCISGRKPSVRTQTRIGLGAEAAMRLLAGWGGRGRRWPVAGTAGPVDARLGRLERVTGVPDVG